MVITRPHRSAIRLGSIKPTNAVPNLVPRRQLSGPSKQPSISGGILETFRRWHTAFRRRLCPSTQKDNSTESPQDQESFHPRVHQLSDLARVAKPLELPSDVHIKFLDTHHAVETAIAPILAPLAAEEGGVSQILVSMDTERNIMRTIGVSVIQLAFHSIPRKIFVIPVHKFEMLPVSLMEMLTSSRVIKIGNQVNNDLSTLQRQFKELQQTKTFATVDLQAFCLQHGVIRPGDSAALQALLVKALGRYMDKKPHDYHNWEGRTIPKLMLNGAALDAYAIRLIYEKAAAQPLVPLVEFNTQPGTAVSLLGRIGWFNEIVARGVITSPQPNKYDSIEVNTPDRNRLLVDITELVHPDQGAQFYPLPGVHDRHSARRMKPISYTLGQLRSRTGDAPLKVVWPISSLEMSKDTGTLAAAGEIS
ncbi:hypothetical protein CPB83DRAFT_894102 [Crepidotus variabilis]|uniref:3'-5' exonuclease domain-containing protein n=1 Tax=Crepidotus variabilis TaxID=179855 RepID=A0A9P6JQI0_9AGAR|nr:hypothetical protein CPB83DRAFT_894102 [Crepidotus variabilis]